MSFTKIAKAGAGSWRGCFQGAILMAHGFCTHGQDPIAPWLRYNLGKVVVLPQAAVTTSFTDNLFNLSGAQRVADTFTSVTPGLRLKWDENAAVDASLEYRHGEVLIWKNSDFNSSSDTLDGKLSYTAAKWKAGGNFGYLDKTSLQSGILNLGRNLVRSSVITGSGSAMYDWTPKSDVTAALNYRNADYDSRFLVDQEQLEGRLGLSHNLTTRLRLTADVKTGHTTATSNRREGTTVGSFFYGALAGLRGSFTEKLTGSVKVGYEVRQFDGGASFSAATPAVGLDLTYQPSELTQVVLAYDRTTGVGEWQVGLVTIKDAVSLRVTQALGISGRWLVSGNCRVSFGDYQFDPTLYAPGTRNYSRTDAWYGAELAVQYRPQAWLTCSAGYSLDKYDFNFSDPFANPFILARSYFAHRVFLSVAVGF